ncbi:deoxymugineic acid synthase 1-B [Canna indica]|uniref:Deoxymugineic acid synthase 1-B n=1 Tax=Canna indica TaxID=4628 RepID=A0AAQ3L3W4_9LILI|nr:deoxymugineic acid synthase 1-B [Canna indica]
MGTAVCRFASSETMRDAILRAIQLGYRHFDTAARYQSEEPLGEAILVVLRAGFINSRDELFITSKLCNLKLEYLDLYLVHWPVSVKLGKYKLPVAKEELMLINIASVWKAMEECQKLVLMRSIYRRQ